MSAALEQLLEAFADAWNRHDVEALVSMMARYEGLRSVRAAFEIA